MIAALFYYAYYNGLQPIAQQLMIDGAAANAQGGVHGDALQATSYNHHDTIIWLLIEHGADASEQGGHYGRVLQAA